MISRSLTRNHVRFEFLERGLNQSFKQAYKEGSMVLDAGKLVEFDTPKALLEKQTSLLRALVDESADKGTLYAMAEGTARVI